MPTARSDMSFAVSVALGRRRLEWNGTDLNGVFAQRRNLVSPRFLAMLRDILRFNDHATRIALGQEAVESSLSLGEFLGRNGYGVPFRELVPAADGRGDLVVPDRHDACVPGHDLRSVLPQP